MSRANERAGLFHPALGWASDADGARLEWPHIALAVAYLAASHLRGELTGYVARHIEARP